VSNLQRLLAETAKAFGPSAVRIASEVKPLPRIPTSVFSLDARLGGGLPLGRIIEFVGEPSAGKSTITLLTIANAQGVDRRTYRPLIRTDKGFVDASGNPGNPMVAVYIDSEGTFDPGWARTCGVDTDRLYYVPVAYLEQAYDMVSAFIKTGEVDIIVLDSIAALAPSTEVESSMEDQQMGVAARGNNKGLRKMTAELNRLMQANAEHAPMIILINQLRDKIGVMFGSPETTPGGRGQEFFASLRIKVWPEALGKSKKDGDEIVGRTSKFKIEKNKVNGVHGDGEFTLYLRDHGRHQRGQVDETDQVVEWAVKLGTLERSGSWITMPNGDRLQGTEKVIVALLEDRTLYDQVRADVMDRIRATFGQGTIAATAE
jgi:recombination protein RecA